MMAGKNKSKGAKTSATSKPAIAACQLSLTLSIFLTIAVKIIIFPKKVAFFLKCPITIL